jgi:hypothetical protein
MRRSADLLYHVSAAFYLDGVSAVTGQTYDTFCIIAVENTAPYAVACYVFDEQTIDQGRRQYQRALAQYKQCLESKAWPGYSDLMMPLTLPVYAMEFEA